MNPLLTSFYDLQHDMFAVGKWLTKKGWLLRRSSWTWPVKLLQRTPSHWQQSPSSAQEASRFEGSLRCCLNLKRAFRSLSMHCASESPLQELRLTVTILINPRKRDVTALNEFSITMQNKYIMETNAGVLCAHVVCANGVVFIVVLCKVSFGHLFFFFFLFGASNISTLHPSQHYFDHTNETGPTLTNCLWTSQPRFNFWGSVQDWN
jgi:hypothetical protein